MGRNLELNLDEQNDRLYRCYYCHANVDFAQLTEVEAEIDALGDEAVELLYDCLPQTGAEKKPPYIRITEGGAEMLNLCLGCWRQLHIQK
jgi:DNA-directed RNA polymerase subunit RPC12/RpoP